LIQVINSTYKNFRKKNKENNHKKKVPNKKPYNIKEEQ